MLAIETAADDARSALAGVLNSATAGIDCPAAGLRLGIPREALYDFEVNSGLARALESRLVHSSCPAVALTFGGPHLPPTYRSPEGADGGADILAGAGPLGFGAPRLCIEVKSESSPIDRSAVDKLLGAVSKFGAEEALFVSWSGFRTNVQKELAASFFRVRLWTQRELLEALFAHYDQLDEDLKAELPLKRIWTVAVQEDE